MSPKHRIHPLLPDLSIELPDGRKSTIKPVSCDPLAAELTITLSLGVGGDLITHSYTLGLGTLIGNTEGLRPHQLENIRDTYLTRVRARIQLDAVLLGTDLWLRYARIEVPGCAPVEVHEPEEEWMRMAAGLVRPDVVHFRFGPTVTKESFNRDGRES